MPHSDKPSWARKNPGAFAWTIVVVLNALGALGDAWNVLLRLAEQIPQWLQWLAETVQWLAETGWWGRLAAETVVACVAYFAYRTMRLPPGDPTKSRGEN